MKKVIVCPNIERDSELEITSRLCALLSGAGYTATVCPVSHSMLNQGGRLEFAARLKGAWAVIALGGDGTMLQVARTAALANVPVLGINLGNKGFMMELERDELHLAVKALDGDFTIQRRMMLDVSVRRGGSIVYTDSALNEVAVHGYLRMIGVKVSADGRSLSHFSGDGVVCATPTGSTAYSMSAGGPIVEPTAENIIVTPVCAHELLSRSMVLSAQRVVTLTPLDPDGRLIGLAVDGNAPFTLAGGDEIRISRSDIYAGFISVKEMSFYDKVSRKLGEQ